MMNPEFSRQPRLNLPTKTGNAGNGGQPNRPTLVNQRCGTPAPNLFPSFKTTPYNNSATPDTFPLFNTFVQNTVNPIGRTNHAPHQGNFGNAGNGNNQSGAGYKPLPMNHRLSQLGAISGKNQTFPYLTSQLYADGMVNFHHPVYYGVKQGDPETYSQGIDMPRGMGSSQQSVTSVDTPAQERSTMYRSAQAVNAAQRMSVNRINDKRMRDKRDARARIQASAPYQMIYN